MSEEPINRKDDIEQDVRDTADDAEEGFDEAGDKIKAGAKAMGNKIKDPNSDLSTEFKEEKLKEEVKDIWIFTQHIVLFFLEPFCWHSIW